MVEKVFKIVESVGDGCALEEKSCLKPAMQNGALISCHFGGTYYLLKRCKACGYLAFDPPPQSVLDDFYQDVYPSGARSWYNFEADHDPVKVGTRAGLIEMVMARVGVRDNAVLHEFGCAFGGTVAELVARGYIASGSELNTVAVEEARRRGQSCVFDEPADVVIRREHGVVDVLFSYHVIEHFSDPVPFMTDIASCLSEDGVMIFFTPNAFALDPLAFGFSSYPWFAYPEHLNLWSAGSTACVARRTGLEVVDVFTRPYRVRDEGPALQVATPNLSFGALVTSELIDARAMHEELVVVFTRAGSRYARENVDRIRATARVLDSQRQFEIRTWEALADAPPVAPG